MAVSIGYDAKALVLEIEFTSGEVWQYQLVPQKVYLDMISGSIGKYFQAHIKGQYSESRIV